MAGSGSGGGGIEAVVKRRLHAMGILGGLNAVDGSSMDLNRRVVVLVLVLVLVLFVVVGDGGGGGGVDVVAAAVALTLKTPPLLEWLPRIGKNSCRSFESKFTNWCMRSVPWFCVTGFLGWTSLG